MSEHLDYKAIRADTVRQVAKLMAAAAITAPKSGGQLFVQGKHLFVETIVVDDRPTLDRLAQWMRARGKERRETIWFRDAEVADTIDAVLFVGLADWYPPNYDCGACGYATCAEFIHATTPLRDDSNDLEFAEHAERVNNNIKKKGCCPSPGRPVRSTSPPRRPEGLSTR